MLNELQDTNYIIKDGAITGMYLAPDFLKFKDEEASEWIKNYTPPQSKFDDKVNWSGKDETYTIVGPDSSITMGKQFDSNISGPNISGTYTKISSDLGTTVNSLGTTTISGLQVFINGKSASINGEVINLGGNNLTAGIGIYNIQGNEIQIGSVILALIIRSTVLIGKFDPNISKTIEITLPFKFVSGSLPLDGIVFVDLFTLNLYRIDDGILKNSSISLGTVTLKSIKDYTYTLNYTPYNT